MLVQKKMNVKSNKEYAIALFHAYTGHANYRANGRNNTIANRTNYNFYGFCLYTIQEFFDTHNRYPNLMKGTTDYTWCINYLNSKLNGYHTRSYSTGTGPFRRRRYRAEGGLWVYINNDRKYAINDGTTTIPIVQPTSNLNGINYRI